MTQASTELVLGIDLGTTNSCVCVSRDGGKTVESITADNLHPCFVNLLLPSVYCDKRPAGTVLLGNAARVMLTNTTYRERVVSNVKRMMRRPTIQLPEAASDSDIPSATPVEISSTILGYLRKEMARHLNVSERKLTRAVIGVPAAFGMVARNATIEAGMLAGFTQIDLIPEPVAAAFGIGLHKSPHEKIALILDLGGGTFDATLIRVGPQVGSVGFEILGVGGHPQLGGLEWDKSVADLILFELGKHDRFDLGQLNFKIAPQFAWDCEKAKIKLFGANKQGKQQHSEQVLVEVPVRGTYADKETQYPKVPLARFLSETQPHFKRIANVCEDLLSSCSYEPKVKELLRRRRGWLGYFRGDPTDRLDWKDIDEILLVGGGAYMKPLSELVLTLSGKTPVIPPEPQMKAAEGAAICGASRGTGSDLFNYMDLRCPYTLALKYHKKGAEPDYRILVHSSERIPQGGLRKTFKHGVSSGKGSFFRAQLFELDIHTNPNRRLWQPAGELRISNLPPRKSDAPETVMIYLNCDEQFRITVTAKFRGEPVHIKVKEPTEQGHERPESVDMPQPTPEPFDPDDNIVGEDF